MSRSRPRITLQGRLQDRLRVRLGLGVLIGPAACLLVMLGGVGAAQAHTRFIGSDPANGAILTAAPAAAKLTFNEDLLPGSAKVRLDGPSGTAAMGEVVVKAATVAAALPPDLGSGTYTLTWRVTSADGHPVSGAFRFTLTLPAAASMSAADPTATASASDVATPSEASSAASSGAGAVAASPSPSLDTTPVAPTATAAPAGGTSGPVIGALAATLAAAGGLWWWRSRRQR